MPRTSLYSNIASYYGERLHDDFILVRSAENLPFGSTPEKFPDCIAAFCRKGRAKVTIDGSTFNMKKNQMLFIMPERIVANISNSKDFRATYSCVSREFIEDITYRFPIDLFSYLERTPCHDLPPEFIEDAIGYFEFMDKKKERETPYQKDIFYHIAYCFCLDLYDFIFREEMKIPQGRNITETHFERFRKCVADTIRDNLPMTYYSDALSLTEKHLNKIVQKAVGMSAKRYVTTLRIKEIKHDLNTTALSVKEIASGLNFSSTDVMLHMFKRHTGMTPTEYRTKSQKGGVS